MTREELIASLEALIQEADQCGSYWDPRTLSFYGKKKKSKNGKCKTKYYRPGTFAALGIRGRANTGSGTRSMNAGAPPASGGKPGGGNYGGGGGQMGMGGGSSGGTGGGAGGGAGGGGAGGGAGGGGGGAGGGGGGGGV